MKTNRQELLSILEKVSPGLATGKEIIEQSTSFVFMNGHVFTYNDSIAVSHPADIGVEGAVLAKQFHTLLNRTTADEIELSTKENELRMKAGRVNAGIKLQSEITLPIDGLGDVQDFKPLPANFKEGIAFCLFSCSTDMSSPALTCLHVMEDFVESTDNLRITVFDLDAAIDDDLLIPSAAARILCKYNPVEYAMSQGWLHFKCKDGTIFSTRTFDLDYVDVSAHVEDRGGLKIELPNNLKEILERAEVFSKAEMDSDSSVQITLSDGLVKVRGENDAGWIEEESRVRFKGQFGPFEVTPEFLREMLDKKTVVTIDEGVMRFQGDGFIHVVCLLAGD